MQTGTSRSHARRLRPRLAVLPALALLLAALPAAHAQEGTQTITVHAKKFAFVPAEITLKKGQASRLVLVSDDVPHGLAVPQLGIHVDATKAHPSETMVTPTTAGDFKGKCSRFCGMGHSRMLFTVHVSP